MKPRSTLESTTKVLVQGLIRGVFLIGALLHAQPSQSGQTTSSEQEETEQSEEATESPKAAPYAAVPEGEAVDRTRLNLLGEVNSAQGEGRRNENVRLTLIGNNVLIERNERLGISATAVRKFNVDRSYWQPSLEASLPVYYTFHQPGL